MCVDTCINVVSVMVSLYKCYASRNDFSSFEGQTDACAGAGFLFGESMKDRVKVGLSRFS